MVSQWTDEKVELLKKYWLKGLSTSEIGKHLDITKNAVIGKAHRIGLPQRQSPIKKAAVEKKKKMPTPQKAKKKKPEKITLETLKHNMCKWPFGDPQTKNFYFCGKERILSKPYCLEHCQEAYVKSFNDSQKKEKRKLKSLK